MAPPRQTSTGSKRKRVDPNRSRLLIQVRLQPKSSQNRLEQVSETYKAWVSAPPVDGAANDALIKLVSKHFGVAPSRVEIIKGHTSREKTLSIDLGETS